MNAQPILYTTPAGHRRFIERLKAVRARYDAVCADNEAAAESGDTSVWHDNFAYEENQRQMHQLGRRMHDMQTAATRIKIVSPPREPASVCLGATVELRDAESGSVETWQIAGFEDGDASARRMSYTAPLAAALMGAEEGDQRSVMLPDGTRTFEVVRIFGTQEDT